MNTHTHTVLAEVERAITDALAARDRPRLREVSRLAEARLEALSVGRGPALGHVVAEREAWRRLRGAALRAIAKTYGP